MQQERLEHLRREAVRLDGLGVHDRAETIFVRLLQAKETACGADSPDTLDALNDLARCRLNGGQFAAASADYDRLLVGLLRQHGSSDPRVAITRHHLARCRRDRAHREATARLQSQLSHAIRRFCGNDGDDDVRRERVRRVAKRLMERGKVALGARVMQRWIDLRLERGMPEDGETLRGIRAHAIALWNAGETAHAALALQAVVKLRNRQMATATDPQGLGQALADLAACLKALGQRRSAREAIALQASIGDGHRLAGSQARRLVSRERPAQGRATSGNPGPTDETSCNRWPSATQDNERS